MTGGDAPAPGRRRRKLLLALGFLAVVLAAVVLGLPRLLDLNRYRGDVVAAIEKATGGKATLGRISWGISTGLWFEADGLSIARAPGFPVDLGVARVSVRLALRPLLSRKIVVTRLFLETPDVVLRLPGPGEAASKATPSPDARTPSAAPPPVTVEKLVLKDGRFRLEDGVALPGRVLVHTATNIDLSVAPVTPGRTATFDLSFVEEGPAGLGPFKAHGTLAGLKTFVSFENPLLVADVSIPALQVEGLKPFLANTAVIQRLSGQVGLAVHYTWDLGGRHSFDGTLDLDRAAYSDLSLWEAPLPGTATAVAFRMNLDPDQLTFEEVSVKRGPLAVAAHAVLDNLGGAAEIRDASASLQSTVPELIAVVPWNALGPSGPKLRDDLRTAERALSDRASSLRISARGSGFPGRGRVEGSLKGPLRVDPAASGEAAALLRRTGWEDVRGTADVDVDFSLEIARPKDLRLQGRIALREFTAKPLGLPIRFENLEADADVTRDSAEISRLSTIVALPAEDAARDGHRFSVSLEGRVDGWSAQPAVTLRHLETSPIPLAAASVLVPREGTGRAAATVREILRAGGTLAVEELAFSRTELAQFSREPAALFPRSKAVVSFADIVLRPLPGLPAIEQVAGRASLENGVVTANGVRGRAGALSLPDITIQVAGLESRPRAAFWAKGPLHVGAVRNENVQRLLRLHGLESLTGSADVDLRAEREFSAEGEWIGGGSLTLSGVRVVTFPAGVVVDSLAGGVTVSQRAALDVTAEQLAATVDGAPVRLSGTLRGAGSPELSIEATAFAKGLDLARAQELSPSLKRLGLEGRLDMDVTVSLPAAGTAEPRLNGAVSARNAGFRMPGAGLTVSAADVELALSGSAAEILRMSFRLNGQALAVSGRIVNPAEPDVRLAVASPDLDLDHLFPPRQTGAPPPRPSPPASAAGPRGGPAGAAERPGLFRRLTAALSVQAAQGRFRGLEFRGLTLEAAFARGLLTSCDVGLGVAGGRITARLSADLRDPADAPFVFAPQISALSFEEVAPALGLPRGALSGPVSLTGEIRGRAGRAAAFLPGLTGNLQLQMGPGTITKIGPAGAFLAKILGAASAARLLSGGFVTGFAQKGLSYQTVTAESAFAGGGLDIGAFTLGTGGMTLDARGRIDLVGNSMDLKMRLAVLGTVDKVLGWVPVLGYAAQSMTSIPLGAKGPLNDPKVRLNLGQEFEAP
jgi:uncharacterized protein involved in outer membrane biogenesis